MSPPNRSEGSRRAYASIYGAAGMRYAAPQEAMRTDTVAGAAPSCAHTRKPNRCIIL